MAYDEVIRELAEYAEDHGLRRYNDCWHNDRNGIEVREREDGTAAFSVGSVERKFQLGASIEFWLEAQVETIDEAITWLEQQDE